ncbi:histidine phosphatase family protein [Nioella sp.]|uniref:histidine phosphatase family protein n=1 Tax=Nioella sp. TaxID=1912091 RepID=UPI003B522B84
MCPRKPVLLTALMMLAQSLPAHADPLPPETLVERLTQGGYVLYIRHAQTESDYADQVTADPENCATQRVLSRTGWAQARAIGSAIDSAGIPVAEVLSSQYCRAWQTADLAFGYHEETAALNFEPAEDYSDVQIAAMRDRVAPLVLAEMQDSSNRVIVGHDDPFEALTGIYPEPQGVAYVLQVRDGAIEVLGAIAPDAWPGM